jgi:hypothetical protein
MAHYVGIDNGLSGAIAVLDEEQNVKFKFVMPVMKGKKTEYDVWALAGIFQTLKSLGKIYVVLEKAAVRPVSGKRACFMTGGGYYLMQGILSALVISYEIVQPRLWQKELLKGLHKDTKTASIMFCKRKWPEIDLTPTEKARKPHDGIADALCMALYCYRLNK